MICRCGQEVSLVWLHPNGGATCAGDRYCRRCDEWYPNEPTFWYRHGTRSQQCKACAREHQRERRARKAA